MIKNLTEEGNPQWSVAKSAVSTNCPIGWGCRIHRLHLCSEVIAPKECPRYDTKQYDSEAPVMLELRGMWSALSLASLPGQLGSGVVAHERVLSMG